MLEGGGGKKLYREISYEKWNKTKRTSLAHDYQITHAWPINTVEKELDNLQPFL